MSVDPVETALRPGFVVADRYRLVRPIGSGGSSVVWIADHVVTSHRVALKVLTKRGDDVAARFLREARIMARLTHPNIVAVHDVFQLEGDDDALVMVMDLLDGSSLGSPLRAHAPLSTDETARIVLAIASALGAAHELGVVHRDLKPENVFLTSDGSVRVLDFGVAKWARAFEDAALTSSLTEAGAIIGTPHYMAPEQVFGEADVDARADVWALGVVAYECLTGKKPIEGDNFGQLFKSIALGAVASLHDHAPNVPPQIAAVVERMLSKQRDDRPSLDEVAATFAQADLRAPPSTPKRRRRLLVGASVALACGLVVVGAQRTIRTRAASSDVVSGPDTSAAVAPSTTPAALVIDAVSAAPTATARAASETKAPPPPRPRVSTSPDHPDRSAPATPLPSTPLPGRVHGGSPY